MLSTRIPKLTEKSVDENQIAETSKIVPYPLSIDCKRNVTDK